MEARVQRWRVASVVVNSPRVENFLVLLSGADLHLRELHEGLEVGSAALVLQRRTPR